MKGFLLIAVFFCSIPAVLADTIPQKRTIYDIERALEQRKKRLDSTLKQTDVLMDSITKNQKFERSDTLRMLYLLQAHKEREEEERLLFWGKIGVGALLVLLAIGFYVYKKRKKPR